MHGARRALKCITGGSLALIAVLAIPAAVLFGLIYLVWTVSDAVTGRLEHRTDYFSGADALFAPSTPRRRAPPRGSWHAACPASYRGVCRGASPYASG